MKSNMKYASCDIYEAVYENENDVSSESETKNTWSLWWSAHEMHMKLTWNAHKALNEAHMKYEVRGEIWIIIQGISYYFIWSLHDGKYDIEMCMKSNVHKILYKLEYEVRKRLTCIFSYYLNK